MEKNSGFGGIDMANQTNQRRNLAEKWSRHYKSFPDAEAARRELIDLKSLLCALQKFKDQLPKEVQNEIDWYENNGKDFKNTWIEGHKNLKFCPDCCGLGWIQKCKDLKRTATYCCTCSASGWVSK
jgi:hypothetical protein